MKDKERLYTVLLVLLIALTGIILMKQLQLFSLFVTFFELIYTFAISFCFVLLFEPLIEKVPFKNRGLRCSIVYLFLFVLVLLIAVLLVPVIVNEWEKLLDLFHVVMDMTEGETEMAFSYESAVNSTITFVRSFADIALSYLLAFFLSLEYPELKKRLSRFILLDNFFDYYDEFKEIIFQYIKALALDLSILFAAQSIVLSLFHVKYAVSLAFGLAVLNIVPYFGATIGQILIFLVDYLMNGSFRFSMILSVFVVQQIESNCIQPVLYGKMMNLKPLYMFTSILFFGALMGVTGVLFAPIFAVAIQFFLHHIQN